MAWTFNPFTGKLDATGSGGGVTDHGALSGLADDDHEQYHNDTRGDARYYTQGQVDTALGGKADASHTHVEADITDLGSYAVTGHTHTVSDISDFPALADVATSGDYNDLINTPSAGGLTSPQVLARTLGA